MSNHNGAALHMVLSVYIKIIYLNIINSKNQINTKYKIKNNTYNVLLDICILQYLKTKFTHLFRNSSCF